MGGWGKGRVFELELFEVAVGLVDGELVDAAVGLFASGDGDGLFELGATVLLIALLCEEAAFKDEEVGVAEVVAGFGDEFGGAGEGVLGGGDVGRVGIESHVTLEEASVGFVEAEADALGESECLIEIALRILAVAEVAVEGGAGEEGKRSLVLVPRVA